MGRKEKISGSGKGKKEEEADPVMDMKEKA